MRPVAVLALSLSWCPVVRAQEVRPWTEAVVSVRDLEGASRLFRDVGGWQVTGRGTIDRSELRYWKLGAGVRGAFIRICAPGADTGCIRFVRFDGVPQKPIRLAARPWDTGGIFSVMVRSDNVQALFDRAIASGWWAESEPIGFRFGGSVLKNVVLQGPHGFNLAVYERTSPAFTAFPLGAISQGFNAMRMVKNQRAAVAFYRDKLGFAAVFDSDYRDPTPQPSNFSLPQNLTTSVIRRAAALQPTPGETGRVEVMEFVGLTGRDFSAAAEPPNLGIMSLRYPVRDLAAYRRQLETRGVTIAFAAEGLKVAAIGRASLIGVRDPDGAITEFYEVARD
jgi:catechol 2,3-dioxygenase-like lactoylglutathione lyase family enzyme